MGESEQAGLIPREWLASSRGFKVALAIVETHQPEALSRAAYNQIFPAVWNHFRGVVTVTSWDFMTVSFMGFVAVQGWAFANGAISWA